MASPEIHNIEPKPTHVSDAMPEKRNTVRALVEADLLDERYTQTSRGLRSRHVQMYPPQIPLLRRITYIYN